MRCSLPAHFAYAPLCHADAPQTLRAAGRRSASAFEDLVEGHLLAAAFKQDLQADLQAYSTWRTLPVRARRGAC
jgi:hypothetical protein